MIKKMDIEQWLFERVKKEDKDVELDQLYTNEFMLGGAWAMELLEEYHQYKLKNNDGLRDVVEQRELLISFIEFRDEVYWGENEFTENKDIIELWFKRNK